MRILLLPLLIGFFQNSSSYRLETVSSLKEACSIQDADNVLSAWKQGLCSGALLTVIGMNARDDHPKSCPKVPVNSTDFRRIFLTWFDRHPGEANKPYVDGLIAALSEAFPCKK